MFRAALAAFVLAVAAAAPAAAQDPSGTPAPTPTPEPPRIAEGVSAAGVDLSNLTIEEATARLTETLDRPLRAPVIVAVAGKRFKLTAKRAQFSFDAERTARRAYYAGVNDPPSAPAGGGAPAALDVPVAVVFRRAPIRDFALRVARKVRVRARDAKLRITLTRMIRRKPKRGRELDVTAVRAQIEAALADPRLPRLLRPGRVATRPRINMRKLRRIYSTVVTVDKAHFRLRVFKRLRFSKSYGVAVGQPAYPTPSGLFSIQNKQVNPTWTAPNSPWAGEMAGQSVSGGAWNNPLKARWLGIANGVGIHGTGQEWSIGSRASHGCIRMRVADVIDLYPRVPVGTRVLIR